jgi:hypothetical protein
MTGDWTTMAFIQASHRSADTIGWRSTPAQNPVSVSSRRRNPLTVGTHRGVDQ